MPLFSQSQVISAVSGRLLVASGRNYDSVSTDTRALAPNALYFAIHGENSNGHKYLNDAKAKGAAGVVIDESVPGINYRDTVSGDWSVIEVTDTLFALGQLAKYHRAKFSIPFVGITGSAGKTTVKEMTASILSAQFNTLKSQGNYNNEIGLPLTLFNLTGAQERGVVEFGMRGLGQVSYLASIVRPHVATITNIGSTHMEILGSKDNIAQAKSEILEYLQKNGTAVLPRDDAYYEYLREKLDFSHDVVTFGNAPTADVYPKKITFDNLGRGRFWFNCVGVESFEIALSVPGTIQVTNALAAAASALSVGATFDAVKEGLEGYVPDTSRMRLLTGKSGYTIVDDTYNANPEAMAVALNYMEKVTVSGKKIAVLADMRELGPSSEKFHLEAGEKARKIGIDTLICVGEYAKFYAAGFGENAHHFADNASATDFVSGILGSDDIVLVKGSNSMNLIQVVNDLKS